MEKEENKTNFIHFLSSNEGSVNYEMIKSSIEMKADVNALCDKKTALYLVSSDQKLEVNLIKLFIDHKSEVNLLNGPKNRIALHEACLNEKVNLEILNLLIEKKSNVNLKDSDLNLPIHLLSKNEKITPLMLDFLIKKKSSINTLNNENESLLQSLLKNKKISRQLLECMRKHKILKIRKLDELGQNALHLALLNEGLECEVAEYLVYSKCQLNLKNKNEEIPLFHALRNNNIERLDLISFLINKRSDLNLRDSSCNTSLYISLLNERVSTSTIKFLIENETNMNTKNERENTALHVVANKKEFNFSIFKLLIEKKCDLNEINSDYESPFFMMLGKEDIDENVLLFMLENNADLNSKNKIGDTPINFLLKKNKLEENIISILVEKKSSLNTKNKVDYTPLHIIAERENFNKNIFQLLIENNSDLNSKNMNNETPFFLACKHKNIDLQLLQFLIDCKCDLNTLNKEFCSPFSFVKDKSFENLKFFVENSLDINLRVGMKKNSVLHYYCSQDVFEEDVLKYLIEKKADLNIPNKNLFSPLHLLLSREEPKKEIDLAMMKYFVENKALLNQQNKKMENILVCYLQHTAEPCLEILQYLLEHKSDVNVKNNFKKTALCILLDKREVDFRLVECVLQKNPVEKSFKNLFLIDQKRFLFFLSQTNVKIVVDTSQKLECSFLKMNTDYLSGELWNTTRHNIFPQNVKQNLFASLVSFKSVFGDKRFSDEILKKIYGYYFVSNSNQILYF